MLDNKSKKRASLKQDIKKMFREEPEIFSNVNIKSGIFRVAMSEDEVTGFLNEKPIKSWKIAELDEDIRDLLADDPEEAGKAILDELINSSEDVEESKNLTREAQKMGYDDTKLESITEKQLEKGGPLHPRRKDERDSVQEKQLDGNSYDYKHTERKEDDQVEVTEKQLEKGGNPNPDTSPREAESRDSVQEKQLDSKSKYTDSNDRRDYEESDITEEQLNRDRNWDDTKGVTEKQLSGKEHKHFDKVLIHRLSSKEEARKFATKVAYALAKRIVDNELNKEEAIRAIGKTAKNFNSLSKIANSLKDGKNDKVSVIAFDALDPESLTLDTLSDPDVSGEYDAGLIANVLRSLVENPKFEQLVAESMGDYENSLVEDEPMDDSDVLDSALNSLDDEGDDMAIDETQEDLSHAEEEVGHLEDAVEEVENDVEDVEELDDGEDDGLVAVEGDVADLAASGEKDIVEAGYANAYKIASEKNEGKDLVRMQFKLSENGKKYMAIFGIKGEMDYESKNLKKIVAERYEARMKKQAQMPPAGGGMPNMGGGDPMAAGGGTTMPAGPAGDMAGTPPVEDLGGDDLAPDLGMEDNADMGGEPSPPGTVCPVCGTDDVELENGRFECNKCNSTGTISVSINVAEWPGTLEDTPEGSSDDLDEEGMGGMDMGGELGGEAEMPLAASVTNVGEKFKKYASEKGMSLFRVGGRCPGCGSDNVEVSNKGLGDCLSCGQKYASRVKVAGDDIVQLNVWKPLLKKAECSSCKKNKDERVEKSASQSGLFPTDACYSKMANRYGLNAVAMSGPCAGKPLADCVCGKLKAASRFSEGLMIKTANRLLDKDPMEECIEDKVREEKLSMKEACKSCEALRKKAFSILPEEEEVEMVVDTDGVEDYGSDLSFEPESDDFGLGEGLGGLISELIGVMEKIRNEVAGDDVLEDSDDTIVDEEEGEVDPDSVDEGFYNDSDDEDDSDDDSDDVDNSVEDVKEGSDVCPKCNKEDCSCGGKPCGDDREEVDACGNPPVMAKSEKNQAKEGENSESINQVEESNSEVLANLDGKKIRRYSEGDSLRSAKAEDIKHINDVLGDRKISDSAKEVTPTVNKSQDQKDIGKVRDGGTMGHEEKFDAKEPDVPRTKEKMGPDESQDFEALKVPAGNGAMGSEKETVGDDVQTDLQGQDTQKAAKTDKVKKQAGEKKVEEPKSVDKSKDLKKQKLQDHKTMGHEEKFDAKDHTAPMDNQLMGPDESKDFEKPSVPAGDGAMGHESETIDTDVSVETKGTTIAEGSEEIKKAKVFAKRVTLANKLASLRLRSGDIEEEEYEEEVEMLSQNTVQTLQKQIEREIKKAERMQRESAANREQMQNAYNGGVEQPIIMPTKNDRSMETLTDKLQSMMTLDNNNKKYEKYLNQ